jgi:hypothetical protein
MRACCCFRSRRSARLAFVQALRAGAVVPLKGWSLTDVAAASDGACLRANRSVCACDRHAHATDATAHEASIAQRSAVRTRRRGGRGGRRGDGGGARGCLLAHVQRRRVPAAGQRAACSREMRWCMVHGACSMLHVVRLPSVACCMSHSSNR